MEVAMAERWKSEERYRGYPRGDYRGGVDYGPGYEERGPRGYRSDYDPGPRGFAYGRERERDYYADVVPPYGYGRDYERDYARTAGAGYGQERKSGFQGVGPKGYRRSDQRIREDVCDDLTEDPSIDASEIDVMVSQGEVTLSGTVDSRYEKRRAEDWADRALGVTHVQNNLRIEQSANAPGMAGEAPRREVGTTSGTAGGNITGTVGAAQRAEEAV